MALTAEERESAEILRFDSLPADEQALLEKALPDGSHESCEKPPDDSPWWSFARRPEQENVYVEYDCSFHVLSLYITDMHCLGTASHPPGEKLEEC